MGVYESAECEVAALSNIKSEWMEALVLLRCGPLGGQGIARWASLCDTSLSFL